MERGTAEIIVKVWAVLGWIGAAVGIIGGIALMFGGALFGSALMGLPGGEAAAGGVIGVLAIIGGLFAIAVSVFSIFVSLGLWHYRNWARIVTLVFSVLGVLSIIGMNFIGAIIGALGVWLFGFEPTVKSLFVGSSAPAKK